jgi:hypothetical protein
MHDGAAYANIDYSLQECRMYKTAIQDSPDFLHTFSVKLIVSGNAALEAILADTNNEIALKLEGLTSLIGSAWQKHAPNVALTFDTNNGVTGALMPGAAFGAYILNSDHIRIHITRYDFANNSTSFGFLDGSLIKNNTPFIEMVMSGTFVAS